MSSEMARANEARYRRRRPRYEWGAECPTCRDSIKVQTDSQKAIQDFGALWRWYHHHGAEADDA